MRAAATGALDYSQADPKDINWRIRQNLVLNEITRQEELRLYESLQRHWLAYVAHGSLTEESYARVRESAGQALVDVQVGVYPWLAQPKAPDENAEQKDTIDPETRELIKRYKQQAEAKAEG